MAYKLKKQIKKLEYLERRVGDIYLNGKKYYIGVTNEILKALKSNELSPDEATYLYNTANEETGDLWENPDLEKALEKTQGK